MFSYMEQESDWRLSLPTMFQILYSARSFHFIYIPVFPINVPYQAEMIMEILCSERLRNYPKLHRS